MRMCQCVSILLTFPKLGTFVVERCSRVTKRMWTSFWNCGQSSPLVDRLMRLTWQGSSTQPTRRYATAAFRRVFERSILMEPYWLGYFFSTRTGSTWPATIASTGRAISPPVQAPDGWIVNKNKTKNKKEQNQKTLIRSAEGHRLRAGLMSSALLSCRLATSSADESNFGLLVFRVIYPDLFVKGRVTEEKCHNPRLLYRNLWKICVCKVSWTIWKSSSQGYGR